MFEYCSVEGCEDPRHSSNGYCRGHYKKWKKYGDPNIIRRRAGTQRFKIIDENTAAIPLTKGYEALVDIEDAESVSKFPWLANEPSPGYVRALRVVNRTSIFLHSFLLGVEDGSEIDHIDNNPLNNRKNNLRLVSHTENMRNSDRYRNRAGGGVTFNKRANLWMSYIDETDKKRKYLGYSKTEGEAYDLLDFARCQ